MRTFLFILLCGLSSSLQAQSLVFCSNYEADGSPLGEDSQWTIGKDGSNIYVLFRANGKVADGARLNFRMRSTDGKVDARIPMEYNSRDGFVVVDFFFDVAGTFEATMTNDAGQQLAQATATVSLKAENTRVSTASFAQAKVGFAESIVAGQAQGVAQVFGIGRDGGTIQVFVTNNTPFYTDQLVVDVWAREGKSFSRHIETLTLNVDPNSSFVNFPYDFEEPNLYRFSFFTKGETFIQHGYIKTEVE
jgi:hypothetical protein